ncbi:MAG: glutathionylspermidine synthase family protein [Actinobacteria bacterium]|nr:glutathionylspermidine synthase family protein [Actinomycetota bacterium]
MLQSCPAGEATELATVGAALPPREFETVRRTAILRHCKWDPQVGDHATLAPFPLVLDRAAARTLDTWAERLAAEAIAAEQELLHAPWLHEVLAVPRAIRTLLRRGLEIGWTPAAGRVMRFDFHPTAAGWRLSEVNADVPGGFSEATEFTRLMAERHPGLEPAGSPGPRWVDAIVARAPTASIGVLIYAPGFTEDLQVVSYVASLLRARGCRVLLAQPQHLRWRDGRAHVESDWHRGPVDFVVRFFQAEWLPRLPRRVAWQPLISGGRTPVANPGIAVLLESKRFPLAWDRLRTLLPTWRELLPETRELPRDTWRTDASWVLKSAYSNNGDDVLNRDLSPPAEWSKATRWFARAPRHSVAQRRFDSLPLGTPWGPMHVCIGVYTVEGIASGMYGRVSHLPIVDYRSSDAAVLIGVDE